MQAPGKEKKPEGYIWPTPMSHVYGNRYMASDWLILNQDFHFGQNPDIKRLLWPNVVCHSRELPVRQ